MQEYSRENIEKSVRELLAQQKVPNILICGQTGVGKSSVVNLIFNDSVASVSDFEPCTKDIKLFKSNYVNIYDSEGYEIGEEKQKYYKKMLLDEFLIKKKNSDDAPHLVWYAISGSAKKYTDTDIEIIQCIKEAGYPLCVLITKIDNSGHKTLGEIISALKQDLPDTEIFRISNRMEEEVQKLCDREALEKWSYNALEDVMKDRFVAALKGGLEEKKEQAEKRIMEATAIWQIISNPKQHIVNLVAEILVIYNIKIKNKPLIGNLTSDTIESIIIVADKLIDFAITHFTKSKIAGKVISRVVHLVANQVIATQTIRRVAKTFSYLCYKQCKDSIEGKKKLF
jgi:predicted GTPase